MRDVTKPWSVEGWVLPRRDRHRSDGTERATTYGQLLEESLVVAGGLRSADLPVGAPVILLAGGGEDFLPGFLGRVGGRPSLPAGVDDAVSQQQLGDPVPGPHQV